MRRRFAGFTLAALSVLPFACRSAAPSFEDRRAADHNRAGAEAFQRGDMQAAALHFERALELGAALADLRAQADARNNLGIVFEALGRSDEAAAHYAAALALARPDSRRRDAFVAVHPRGVLAASLNLARLASAAGDFERARVALSDADGAARGLESAEARVDVAKQRAATAFAEGGPTEAVLAAAADAVARATQLDRSAANLARQADARIINARALLAGGAPERALSEATAAAALAREVSDRSLAAAALEVLADIDRAAGRFTEARERLALALDVHIRRPNAASARRTLERLIEVAELEERTELAERYRKQLAGL